MGEPSLLQFVCWTNSLTESFEVTKWYDVEKVSPQQIENEMLAISRKLYTLIVEKRKRRELQKAITSVGMSNQVWNGTQAEANEITGVVHYGWYRGKCLDPDRLSYFDRKETIEEGTIPMSQLRDLQFK